MIQWCVSVLIIIRSKTIWPLNDLGLPMHDRWPNQYSTLQSGALPIKFGCHRALLNSLTLGSSVHEVWPHQRTLWSRFFPYEIWLPWGFFWAIWPQLTPANPCMTFDPGIHFTLVGVLPTKFGGQRASLKQLDLWMTFDLWWGSFENMPTKSGPSPTPMPSYSSIPQSTTKRIAVQVFY